MHLQKSVQLLGCISKLRGLCLNKIKEYVFAKKRRKKTGILLTAAQYAQKDRPQGYTERGGVGLCGFVL